MIAHECAEVFRLLTSSELEAMAADIQEKGLLNPIITHQGKILDGRNRYAACKIAGVEPRFEEYTGNDPLGAVVSLNEIRRHETASQRSMAAARLAKLKMGHRPPSPIGGGETKTRDEAAEMLGVGTSSLDRAKQIMTKGIPALADMVDSGEVTVDAARLVATLPESTQREAISGGVAGVKEAAKKLRNTKKESADFSSPPESLDGSQSPPPTSGYDGSLNEEDEPVKRERKIKIIPDDADRLWLMAKQELGKILPSDRSRERVLKKVIEYCEERISSNK